MAIIPNAPTQGTPFAYGAASIPASFTMLDTEREAARAWMRRHMDGSPECRPGSSGELFCFGFTPSGMGEFIEVRCIRCDEKEDITDTRSW